MYLAGDPLAILLMKGSIPERWRSFSERRENDYLQDKKKKKKNEGR